MQSSWILAFLGILVEGLTLAAFVLLSVSVFMIWLNLRQIRVLLQNNAEGCRAASPEKTVASPDAVQASDVLSAADMEVEKPPLSDKIGFACPECGKFFEGPATLSGTTYQCPECRSSFCIH
jgi:predicted RNA-binding Zn-ribbon protein involved in translation (DUF1610 family)